MNDTKAVEVIPNTSLEAYAENMQRKLDFCALLLKTQMCPKHYETKEQVLAAILYGQELGFSPIQSLQCINVIQNKPSIDASGIKAKILQHGGRFETKKWDRNECTLTCWRGDWHETFTYTMDDAKAQGLAGKENWQKMPKNMLFARCVTTLGRNMYADVLKNLHGTEEMMDAPESEEDKATRVEVETIKANAQPKVFLYDFPEGLTDEQLAFMEENAIYGEKTKVWHSPDRLPAKLDKYLVDVAKVNADMAMEGDDLSDAFKGLPEKAKETVEPEVVKSEPKKTAVQKAQERVANAAKAANQHGEQQEIA